jgi:predicted 3-demethylubiquinone-9 3-methyltransferase (glyoxalase superfamily)
VQKITPCLWFNGQVEEAITFYRSIFTNSTVESINRYGEGGPMPAGTVLTATAVFDGQRVMFINGGPTYQLSPAFSFFVDCASQEEVDDLWAKLTDGGEESQCGWLKDRFVVSWQIVPQALGRLLGDPDPAKSQRVMEAMLKMHKIESAVLQAAYDRQ